MTRAKTSQVTGTATVTVGCKLPNGLRLPLSNGQVLHLTGSTNGAGLTFGVPTDVWDDVKVQYANSKFLKDGLVFAHEKNEVVQAELVEKRKEKTGFDAIDPTMPDASGQIEVAN